MFIIKLSFYLIIIVDSPSSFIHRQNNKNYVASEEHASWYDARNECLRLGGDLASIVNLRPIGNWPLLTKNQRYWIGLQRNKWIWKSTGYLYCHFEVKRGGFHYSHLIRNKGLSEGESGIRYSQFVNNIKYMSQ